MKNVLLLEEDQEGREVLAKVLRKRGFSVLQAADEQSALNALREKRPVDVVIAGVTDRDRLEFLADVRERRPRLPVVFLTDHCSPESWLRGLLFGAFAMSRRLNFYLNTRPIRLQELEQLLLLILDRRRAGSARQLVAA